MFSWGGILKADTLHEHVEVRQAQVEPGAPLPTPPMEVWGGFGGFVLW